MNNSASVLGKITQVLREKPLNKGLSNKNLKFLLRFCGDPDPGFH